MTPFTTTYKHGNTLLTVSGERDADDCWLTRITAIDSQIDLCEMLDEALIDAMAVAVDEQLREEARRQYAEDRAFDAWSDYQARRQGAYDRCPA